MAVSIPDLSRDYGSHRLAGRGFACAPLARALGAAALALASLPAAAAAPTLGAHLQHQAISLDADSFELDYKNGIMIYHKVHIAQGNMSITADQSQTASTGGNGLNFDDNRWKFHGDVKIAMNQGLLTSDDAEITFANKQLVKAVANGKPAAFEQRIEKTGKLAQGHADSIDYDVAQGVVRLTRNAWLSDGEKEISGESLKYNVVSQNIIAEGAEQGSQRVHIIITPPANPKP
ncbi:MAG TPA: lipopolysaccharide transport periplasmic protein LptA [Steroidobacteraceae bacterium]|jgi:lipopolysaccharide export system protein LptA|nr:lipopolysaccharide transport periplasmic protein LptA [Steroidobacteraceae bacterium]